MLHERKFAFAPTALSFVYVVTKCAPQSTAVLNAFSLGRDADLFTGDSQCHQIEDGMAVLPEEMIAYILSLLDERTLRYAVPYVCTLWAKLVTARGVWRSISMTFDSGEEVDFAERSNFVPPAVHTLTLLRPHDLDDKNWSVVLANASNVRRILGLAGDPGQVMKLLRKCKNSVEELTVYVDLSHSQGFLWDLMSSMPRLRSVKLCSESVKWAYPAYLHGSWSCVDKIDLSELRSDTSEALIFLRDILQLRKYFITAVFLSYDTPLTTKLMKLLVMCPNLREFGIHCDADLSRVDALQSLQALTLIGCSHRGTRDWVQQSSTMKRISSLTFDSLRERGALYNILPVVGQVCKCLRKITFQRSQVDPRFPRLLKDLPLTELHCENVQVDQIHEMRHLPKLTYLRVWGHLGNYKTMMKAVSRLRTAKPLLRIAGLEDCYFNHWGKNANRAFL